MLSGLREASLSSARHSSTARLCAIGARTLTQNSMIPASMRVTILYFAAARGRAGVAAEALELPEGATAAQAPAAACERHPALAAIASKPRAAGDQDFAPPQRQPRGRT